MTTREQFLHDHATRFEAELIEFLRIPSVSAAPERRADVHAAAEFVATQLKQCGLSPEIIETAGHPLVFAASPPVPGRPVALVYGHYDVQPPEPLDLWHSPPFEPTVRDGNIYARGATDDKGQLFTHLKSLQAWLQTEGSLPLQVKVLIEGEEEVGSEQLHARLPSLREKLACNVVVISDNSQFAPGVPAITYGLRGIAYYELRLTGPSHDLHSGTFGGGVTNPANALAKLLAALVDEEGRITLPGFYNDVLPLTARERTEFARLPFDEAKFLAQIGVTGSTGESGYTTLERRWARPTCDINGLWSGYQGTGAKTVLPSQAGAKFSFRLVPNQNPQQLTAALRQFLTERCPPGITLELIDFHGAPAALTALESPFVAAAARAIERGFGTAPVFMREGGSIPIVTAFQHELGAAALLLGWGLDDDRAHSPNEKFCLADFHRGTRASLHLWEELAQVPLPTS
jgi:succinyl-diaminopimelate desuccinylase